MENNPSAKELVELLEKVGWKAYFLLWGVFLLLAVAIVIGIFIVYLLAALPGNVQQAVNNSLQSYVITP